MTALWTIFRMILRAQPKTLWRGALLSFAVLAMGVALLGLSGWFITAAAAAGLAGMGAVFDVFRPSAMVRFLALGRAAARYGERVLTHDATLRALEVLRLRVLQGFLAAPYGKMIRIRGAQALSRLTADIDALDGVSLRLILPIVAGLVTQLVAFGMIWWLVALPVALWIFLGYLIGAAVIFWQSTRRSAPLSRRAEAGAQAFRARLIDLIQTRRDLAVYGRIEAQRDSTLSADARRLALRRAQDRADRMSGALLQLLGTVVAAGALWLGLGLAQSGAIAPALAALGFFAALALAETIAPLRRAASDLGRMIEAARRVARDIDTTEPAPRASAIESGQGLRIEAVSLHRPATETLVVDDLTLSVAPGETVALTGPSGSGKSTLLLAVAGLHPVAAGRISLGGQSVETCDEGALRHLVTLLPQRSALMAGTVAENLRLGAPDAEDALLWQVLDSVQLSATLRPRGGLNAQIGPMGDGLSGGEARRLTLARALLRRPEVLLLDEPTEGLDDATARAVLSGLRHFLPDAAILIAAHRGAEIAFADRRLSLK